LVLKGYGNGSEMKEGNRRCDELDVACRCEGIIELQYVSRMGQNRSLASGG
jgi:hypothetical protein